MRGYDRAEVSRFSTRRPGTTAGAAEAIDRATSRAQTSLDEHRERAQLRNTLLTPSGAADQKQNAESEASGSSADRGRADLTTQKAQSRLEEARGSTVSG